jgi:hypothetical protein
LLNRPFSITILFLKKISFVFLESKYIKVKIRVGINKIKNPTKKLRNIAIKPNIIRKIEVVKAPV